MNEYDGAFSVVRNCDWERVPAETLGLSYGSIAGWIDAMDGSHRLLFASHPIHGVRKMKVCPVLEPYTGDPGVYEMPEGHVDAVYADIKRRRATRSAETVYGLCAETGLPCECCDLGTHQPWSTCMRRGVRGDAA